MMSFGKLLIEARSKRGETAKILAERLQPTVSASYLSNLELGLTVPSKKMLISICEALDLSYNGMLPLVRSKYIENCMVRFDRSYKLDKIL